MPDTGSEFQLIAGLVIAIALLIFFVVKTRVHAIVALIAAASIAGIIGGMLPAEVITSITTGFGKTLSTIGLVIGFGVMMGRILEVSGAAEQMAYTLIRWVGKKREDWAMVLTGYIVSIPIFCDSAFVILTPLIKGLARSTGISILTLGISLAGGLMLTHHAVPPTPGPLGVAGIFNIDLGLMIFWGIVFTIPGMAVLVMYGRAMGPRLERMILVDTGEDISAPYKQFEEAAQDRQKTLPSLGLSVLPIALPIVLIFLNTLSVAMLGNGPAATGFLAQTIAFFGNPVIAVGLGLMVAAYTLLPGRPREEVLAYMEEGVESAGIILLVTGAGGALGAVLRDSGAGGVIGQSVAGLAIPAILIPFVISSIVRLIQGSGTVAMITGASISAPILMNMPDVNMVFAAQAAAIGSMVFGYFNDSYFWVINRMLGVKSAKHQMLLWSVPTTLTWATALVMLLICNALFG
ncbi:GntP family permease [Loktanella sp. M215]|uniref:GntP family permease n=1 Tax=Loktanella sp. M215 TaxID=2675431 RepID=UPI001F34345E|nr:gluconate:H+ symporter [Loktanella sp. M215]MCF7702443.1 GntP family permease [Loktanella sp. M215]